MSISTGPKSTALITGASTGIGRDLAHLFAQDHHNLILISRTQPALEKLAANLKQQYKIDVQIIPQDLSDPASPQKLFEQLQSKPIHFLVNNAGFGSHGRFSHSDIPTTLSMLQLNITTLTHLTRLFLPQMLDRRWGKILNVASLAAYLPGPLMSVYYATKAYVLSFSQALSSELKNTGVTVTALCPGPTKTEFQSRAGISNSLLFKNKPMDSMTAARIGYQAMQKGRRTAIPGALNKLSAFSTRFLPRSLTASVAKKLNQSR